MRPDVANVIFVLFLFCAFYYLNQQNALTKFLRVGPDEKNPAEFIGMKLDNWEKVIMVMITSFIMSLMSAYVNTVNKDKLQRFLNQNSLTEKIPMSKLTAQIILVISPILWKLMSILSFFLNTTFELQYILPNLIGQMIIDVPYDIYKLSQQRFTE